MNKTRPAPLWRRLFAMAYDSLLLFSVIMLYVACYIGLKVMILGDSYREQLNAAPAGSTAGPLMFVGMIITIYFFFYLFWARNGQTLGMQAWRLRIQQADSSPPDAQQTLIRLLVAPLSFACLGLGFWFCLFGKKQSWQDYLSQTETVLLPKKEEPKN